MNQISLLIPCYNTANFLENVLNTAVSQTDPFDEIICYDDGSEDETLEVLYSFQKNQYSELKIIEGRENKGLTKARNALLKEAKYPYVSYQDSDDPLNNTFVEKMRPYLCSKILLACRYKQVEVSGDESIKGLDKIGAVESPLTFLLNHFYQLNSVIFDKSLLDSIGGFEENITLYEDKEMLLRYILNGGELYSVSDVLACWLKRPGSTMHREGWEKHNRCLLTMAQKLHPLFKKEKKEVFTAWKNYLEQKMRTAYLMGSGTSHFNQIAEFIDEQSSLLHRLLCKCVGFSNYLKVLRFMKR